jgi:hypothetical protein
MLTYAECGALAAQKLAEAELADGKRSRRLIAIAEGWLMLAAAEGWVLLARGLRQVERSGGDPSGFGALSRQERSGDPR